MADHRARLEGHCPPCRMTNVCMTSGSHFSKCSFMTNVTNARLQVADRPQPAWSVSAATSEAEAQNSHSAVAEVGDALVAGTARKRPLATPLSRPPGPRRLLAIPEFPTPPLRMPV